MFKTCVAMLSVRIRMLKCALNTLLVFHLSAFFFENALMCRTSPHVLYVLMYEGTYVVST